MTEHEQEHDKGQESEEWERHRDAVMRLAATDEGIEILQRRAMRVLLRLKDEELQQARQEVERLRALLQQAFRWFDEWAEDDIPEDAKPSARQIWLLAKQALQAPTASSED